MGTEMRIGIAAGLVIVAATSVYFIYGSDRSDGDLLLTPEKTADASAAKHNAKDAKKLAHKRARGDKAKRTGQQTRNRRPVRVANARNRSTPTTPRGIQRDNKPNVVSPTFANVARAPRGGTPSRAARTSNSGAETTPHASPIRSTKPNANDHPPIARRTRAVPPARRPAVRKTNPLIRPANNEKSDASPTGKASENRPGTSSDDAATPDKKTTIEPRKVDRPIRVARRTPAHSTTPTRRTVNRNRSPVIMTGKKTEPKIESWPKQHTIASGDTLSQISMAYYGTSRRVDQIIKANPDIKGPRSLKIGRVLVIPEPDAAGNGSGGGIVKLAGFRDLPTTNRHSAAHRKTPARRSSSPVVAAATRKYTVQKGDTFYSIALDVYGSGARWKELFEANKSTVSNPSKLRPGMVLTLPR